MFGNKKTSMSDSGVVSSSSSAINTLVEGSSTEGTITTKSDLRIDGSVNGHINCGGKLIIGGNGRVEGNVNCQNAVIEGHFKGELKVHEVLDVRETANIQGEIKTAKLLVQNGATFNGNCDMGAKMKNITKSSEASAS